MVKYRIFSFGLFWLFLAAFFVFAKASSYAQLGANCQALLDILTPLVTPSRDCSDSDYDHIADFEYPALGGDGDVDINDFSFFGAHSGDEAWCQAQIAEPVDPCPAPTPAFAVPPPDNWFNTIGGNVYFDRSTPNVPSNDYFFSLASLKSRSGIIYHKNTLNMLLFGGGSENDPSPPSWFYQVQFLRTGLYNYFRNKIPNEVPYTGGATFCQNDVGPANQTHIYDVTTDLTIARSDIGPGGCSMSSLQVNNRKKVIVLVSGNLYINNYIDISGGGFLAFIVAGNIIVHDNLLGGSLSDPAIEGVFITDGAFSTGNAGDTLYLEGVFMSSRGTNGFALQRTGPPATRLGEVFIYNPKLLINAPKEIKDINIDWREVIP